MHVTFAAGMTMPGTFVSGQDADAGSAILRTNVAFKAFIISNSIAMVLSTISALWHSFLLAFNLTVLALIAMMLAFFMGSFQHSPIKYSDSQKSSYSHSYNLLMRLPPHIIHTRISVLFQGTYFTFSSDAKGHYLFGLKEE